jgi:hypothetical protein
MQILKYVVSSCRWLYKQDMYSSMMQLLRGPLGRTPGHLDSLLSAIDNQLLQLRVLQLLIWQLSKSVLTAAPSHVLRLSQGPAAPWDHKSTAAAPCAATPSYVACSSSWEELPDAELAALYGAAFRALHPAVQQLPAVAPSKAAQAATVARWLEAQEVALAWAVVKYRDLVSSRMCAVLGEFASFAQAVLVLLQCQLGQTSLACLVVSANLTSSLDELIVSFVRCFCDMQRRTEPSVLSELDHLTCPGLLHSSTHLAQLGQLPVFMTQLGAAVKEQWARFPLYAHFRPVRLPYDVHRYVFDDKVLITRERLEQVLVSFSEGMHSRGGGTGKAVHCHVVEPIYCN